MTWFNVTESFPGLQPPTGPPLRWRGGKPRLMRVNFGCTFNHCLFWVVGGFFYIYLAKKQCSGESLEKYVRIWSGGVEEGARTRSILPPEKSIYCPNSSLPCHIPGASSKSEGQSRGMNRARQPGHLSLSGDGPGGCKKLWGPRKPRLSLPGCVCSAALITEM